MAEKKKTTAKKPAAGRGRPIKITESVVRKLEEGFLKGLSDSECCLYADVAPSTLYDYCKKYPAFSERKELLKKKTALRAKLNVDEAIENGDTELSKWYLERKNKEEFSTKQDVGITGSINNPFEGLTTEELKKLVNGE